MGLVLQETRVQVKF